VKPTVLVLGALILVGPVRAEEARKETLLGVATDFDAGRITFDVASNGCTAKKDFRVELRNGTLTLFRERRDACKGMPEPAKIAFTLAELGLSPDTPFALGNRLIVNVNVAQQQ